MIEELIQKGEEALKDTYKEIRKVAYFNSEKILEAFHSEKVTETDFYGTTGYGLDDIGRDKIERIYARVFKTEDALVRNQFISGTHALSTALFALLRPYEKFLSITGQLYDTLDQIIKNGPSSLKAYNIDYAEISLINNDFDYNEIAEFLKTNKVKLITIQRSKGYSFRDSLSIEKIAKVIKFIKNINKDVIIMVDNCYCELVDTLEPTEVGADICVGSLIKNLGAGIANNGAYIVGKKNLIKLCGERLNMPGEGKDVGPSLGANKSFLLGLYLAPSVVANALKTATLASYIFDALGYEVNPRINEKRSDIVTAIKFKDKDKLIKFVEGVQKGSAIDSFVNPIASDMPGYERKIIMASGSFTQGSSIEFSCDGPIAEPYIAYFQGSLTYDYGKIGLIKALEYFLEP